MSQAQPKYQLNINLTEISSNINGSKTYMISCSYKGRQIALDTFLLPERPRLLHVLIQPAMKVRLATWKPVTWRLTGGKPLKSEALTSILLEPRSGVKLTSLLSYGKKEPFYIARKRYLNIDHQKQESTYLGLKRSTAMKTSSTSKRNGKANGSRKAL